MADQDKEGSNWSFKKTKTSLRIEEIQGRASKADKKLPTKLRLEKEVPQDTHNLNVVDLSRKSSSGTQTFNLSTPFSRIKSGLVDIILVTVSTGIISFFLGYKKQTVMAYLKILESKVKNFSTFPLGTKVFENYYLSLDILAGILAILLFQVLWVYCFNRSLGKILCGQKVLHKSGRNLSLWGIFKREVFFKLFSLGVFGLGLLMMFFNERNQTLHDYFSGTIVVDEL